MRRNHIQPAAARQQEVGNFRDHKRMNNAAATVSRGHGAEASDQTKKLERKQTEDIDASAEAFIKNFRQQLLIQRLQSIENYEQMLARGL